MMSIITNTNTTNTKTTIVIMTSTIKSSIFVRDAPSLAGAMAVAASRELIGDKDTTPPCPAAALIPLMSCSAPRCGFSVRGWGEGEGREREREG
eukprot:1950554-Rhodomonas_salina.1